MQHKNFSENEIKLENGYKFIVSGNCIFLMQHCGTTDTTKEKLSSAADANKIDELQLYIDEYNDKIYEYNNNISEYEYSICDIEYKKVSRADKKQIDEIKKQIDEIEKQKDNMINEYIQMVDITVRNNNLQGYKLLLENNNDISITPFQTINIDNASNDIIKSVLYYELKNWDIAIHEEFKNFRECLIKNKRYDIVNFINFIFRDHIDTNFNIKYKTHKSYQNLSYQGKNLIIEKQCLTDIRDRCKIFDILAEILLNPPSNTYLYLIPKDISRLIISEF